MKLKKYVVPAFHDKSFAKQIAKGQNNKRHSNNDAIRVRYECVSDSTTVQIIFRSRGS